MKDAENSGLYRLLSNGGHDTGPESTGDEMKALHCAAAAALLTLTACETALLPLSVYAVDGLSYASSGKGIADHAISAANNKDCALFRIAQGSGICDAGPALDEAPALAMVGANAGHKADEKLIREILERAEELNAFEPEPNRGAPETARPAGKARTDGSVPFN